jgi:hypothetical protein
VTNWLQIEGTVHAVPARRGDEDGTYLWIAAGEHREEVRAEVFLPALVPQQLDLAMAVGIGMVDQAGEHRTGEVRTEFGRVRDGRGVLSASGPVLEADVRFDLLLQPPDGGFCRHCGTELDIAVQVITPPDGGLIGAASSTCTGCGRS